jgi:4-hydroxymandelate oxidase
VNTANAPINAFEFETIARAHLDGGVFDFFAGGAEDERTVAENRRAFGRLALCPRVLVDVSHVDLTADILGTRAGFPLILAPTALNQLAHPDGEFAAARAAAAAGLIYVVSTNASMTIEDIAKATTGPLWFQLYVHRDRELTISLIERAEAAGYRALMLTVDTPRLGRRERDLRTGFGLPPHITTVNLRRQGPATGSEAPAPYHQEVANQFDPSLTWDILGWLRARTDLPIVVKGILSPADAAHAVASGAAGLVVSNHGGRQLDGAIATIDALPPIAEVVADRIPVLLDGGIRRGTDIVKALALGARAVMIGRPYLWALAAAGEAGVTRLLDLLRAEFESAMALCGCAGVAAIDRSLVARRDHRMADG